MNGNASQSPTLSSSPIPKRKNTIPLNDLIQYATEPLGSSSVPRYSAELNNAVPNITKSRERKKLQDSREGEEVLFFSQNLKGEHGDEAKR